MEKEGRGGGGPCLCNEACRLPDWHEEIIHASRASDHASSCHVHMCILRLPIKPQLNQLKVRWDGKSQIVNGRRREIAATRDKHKDSSIET